MQYTDNPVADFEVYDRNEHNHLQRLPRCEECGEPITDDWCFELGQDEYVCEECLMWNHRKAVEEITEE